jgi:transposase-like protein
MSEHATLRDAILYFAEFENCRQFMIELRWPDGKIACPTCGAEKLTWLEKQRIWKCYSGHARPTFSLKTGTTFEDSPIALEKWLPAVWMLLNCKNGISSYELHRGLGITQKSAWFMLQRIRLAMQDDLSGGLLGGEVEVDETFIGGKVRNMHKDRKMRAQAIGNRKGDKSIVLGILERASEGKAKRVRATVIPDRKGPTMRSEISTAIEKGSRVYSDEFASAWRMDQDFEHATVDHLKTYVNGQVHTNGIENFWSLLKRGIGGTYVSVEPFHLFRYVDEQAFRFNNRETDDVHRFVIGMKQIVNRRLTYKQLIGKEQVTQHG